MKKNSNLTIFILVLIYLLKASVCFADANDDQMAKLDSINKALDQYELDSAPDLVENPEVEKDKTPTPPPTAKEPKKSKVKISGQLHTSMGIDSNGDAIFNRANGNLNEKDYRILDSVALDRGQNTYDPALYSRLKIVTDAPVNPFMDMHLNLAIDPWSFTGKTQKITVNGTGGDSASFQYFFAGNTGYTVNQNINSLINGDFIAMREVKIYDDRVPGTTFTSSFNNTFNVPELKVDYSFMPVREAWFDIKPEQDVNVRVFAMGYQDQALTSDDPFKLSNNTMYWAESPWLWSWQGGNFNSGSLNYTQGQWDRSVAFSTRDSDLQRLTALRGATIKIEPDNDNFLQATVATPKTLWQDYGDVTALPASVRLKHFVDDQAYIGTVTNAHLGFDSEHNLDAQNYTGGLDGAFVPVAGLMVNGQYSASESHYDQSNRDYASEKRGNAYYLSLSSTSNAEGMIRKDYFGLNPAQKTDAFYKTKLYFSRMDRNFESTLANYHDTRQDSFWSRHMTFYPNTYRNMPGVSTNSSEFDLEPFAIGNGIDYGRSVVAWRADTNLMQGKLKGLMDVRHVMMTNNDRVETVARTQWSLQATNKLMTKALLMWQAMPKTVKNEDPFVYDHSTGEPLQNFSIEGGKDPSLKTASLGARYELTPWANINGVWEITNDFTLGSNNIPGGLFSNVAYISQEGLYRKLVSQVYGPFGKPPYDYHNIFKTGLELIPLETWHLYLDYTRNPNKFAGNIDDNMNHFGIESSYLPTKNMGFFARYTFSKWYDINELFTQQQLNYRGYHNVFLETRFLLPADALLSLEYGVGPTYNVETSSVNPDLSYYASPTIETQHLFRIVYDRKF